MAEPQETTRRSDCYRCTVCDCDVFGPVVAARIDDEGFVVIYCAEHEPTDDGQTCPTCEGNGCEEGCGLHGGCQDAHVGPYSHKVCRVCCGSGSAPSGVTDD